MSRLTSEICHVFKVVEPFFLIPDVVSLAVDFALFIHSPFVFMNCEKYIGSLSCSYPDCDGRLGFRLPFVFSKDSNSMGIQ